MIASTETKRTDTATMVLWRRLTAAAPEEKSKCRHCKSLTSHISDESHTVQLGPTFCITMLNKRIQKHTKGQKVNVACTLRIPKCTQAAPWCIFQIRTINLSKYKLPQHLNFVSTSWRCTSLASGSGDLRPIFPVLSHTPARPADNTKTWDPHRSASADTDSIIESVDSGKITWKTDPFCRLSKTSSST